MAVRTLSLEALQHVEGGRVAAAIDQAIKKAVADCEDRPRNQAVRQVQITIGFKPAGKDAAEGEVDFAVALAVKTPKGESGSIRGSIRKAPNATGYVLAFNDLAEDNPHQGTLDDENPDAWGMGSDD